MNTNKEPLTGFFPSLHVSANRCYLTMLPFLPSCLPNVASPFRFDDIVTDETQRSLIRTCKSLSLMVKVMTVRKDDRTIADRYAESASKGEVLRQSMVGASSLEKHKNTFTFDV